MVHARCKTSWLKSVLMYKILNEQSAPSLREKFIKIKDLNREYNSISESSSEIGKLVSY
jgi:hypothetical protein